MCTDQGLQNKDPALPATTTQLLSGYLGVKWEKHQLSYLVYGYIQNILVSVTAIKLSLICPDAWALQIDFTAKENGTQCL